MKLKPPADASDFLMVFYRASTGIDLGANSASEFDNIKTSSLMGPPSGCFVQWRNRLKWVK